MVDALDVQLDTRRPAYSKVLVAQSQPRLRAMLMRLAVGPDELTAVDSEYSVVPDLEVMTLDDAAISQVATTVVAGVVSQEFAEDVCRGLVRRRSELGV